MIVLIYLLKLVCCSMLLYGYYFFFLRNKRMHQYNRFYILASVLLSIALPLIRLPMLSLANEPEVMTTTFKGIAFGGWEKDMVVTVKHNFVNSDLTQQNIIISFYIIGFFIAIFPVLKSLAYIRLLSLKHSVTDVDNIKFYDTAEPGTPFSFFNTVFWNRHIPLETGEGQQIFKHEMYHIRQKHSYDILFMQLASAVLWFNPFFFLLMKELRMVHEFLADEYAASETDKHDYAKMLVMQTVSSKQVLVTNQFFYNQIKRRITMILNNGNTRYSYVRKALTVPVALILFIACSVRAKDDTMLKEVTSADGTIDKVYIKPEIEASYPGDQVGWMTFLNKNFRYPQEAQEQEIQGTVLLEFMVQKDGSVTDLKTIELPANNNGKLIGVVASKLTEDKKVIQVPATDAQSDLLKKEALRVLTLSGKWKPAINNGQVVTSMKRQPITFKLEAQ